MDIFLSDNLKSIVKCYCVPCTQPLILYNQSMLNKASEHRNVQLLLVHALGEESVCRLLLNQVLYRRYFCNILSFLINIFESLNENGTNVID